MRCGGLRILALVTDAHGGFGGISQYNRDVLEAMCGFPSVREVHVIPRIARFAQRALPEKLRYHLGGLGGPLSYSIYALGCAMKMRHVDVVYCAHINLMPTATVLAHALRAPLVLTVYGVDAWKPVRRAPGRILKRTVSALISISELTRDRFLSWCPLPTERTFVVPNAIRIEDYGAKPKSMALLEHYGLRGKTVLMTLGRMDDRERHKGFDTVIELLPGLAHEIPNLVYMAVGGGADRARLEAKAAELGLRDRVIFAGRIEDSIKAEVYRLADAYVMPSLDEGFGFVILEALASGVPVVASAKDGTREAVRGGELGVLVDPEDPADIRRGVIEALKRPRGVPAGLSHFSYENFAERLHSALASICRS